MNKFFTLLAVLLLLSVSTNILAQDDDDLYEKDFLEVAVFVGGALPVGSLGDWTTTSELGTLELGTETGFNLGLDVGHFLTPDYVLGFNFTYSQFSIKTDEALLSSHNHRIFSSSLYLKYYFFGESSWVPYLKGHAGLDFAKFTTPVREKAGPGFIYRELAYDPALAFGFGAGFFKYTHDYGGLFFEANFHNGLTSNVDGSYEGGDYTFGESSTVLDAHFGIKVFFGND